MGGAVAGCQLGKVAGYRVTGSVIARDMGIAPWFGMVCFGMVWYGMGIAPSSSTMPMPIHSEEMYSGRARLHRHGSSADRGTSRHSSRRCDSIVSNRVNTSSSLRAAPQLPFVGKGKRRINLSSEQMGQDTHTGSCCSSRMIIFSKEWHFLEGHLDPYQLATP